MWREVRKKRLAESGTRGKVYEVGSDGVVYSDGLPLKAVGGVWVSVGGARREVAYLVARAFVENVPGRPYVVHKDGDRKNNRAENLEWSEVAEAGAKRGPKERVRPLVQLDGDGNVVAVWNGVPEACRAVGLKAADVRAAARRRGKTGGFWWIWM